MHKQQKDNKLLSFEKIQKYQIYRSLSVAETLLAAAKKNKLN